MRPVSGVYSAVVGELTPSTPLAAGVPIAADDVPQDAVERVGFLFDVHHQRLYRLARRLTRSADDARDLVQETFLRATQAVSSIPVGSPNEEAWLVRVLVNICRDTWRRSAVRRRLDPVHLAGTTTQSANLEHAFIAQTTVWRALERLSPRRRAAVVLYELEGKGIPEIATLLGVTSVTVRWHLSRGRNDLARVIGQEGRERRERQERREGK